MEFVVSDDHAGLKRAVRDEAVWQRCYVHFLRNALDYLPRKADDDWLALRPAPRAEQDLQAWLMRWATRYPKLTDWVEAHIGETLNFYSLPRQHHKHLKSTNISASTRRSSVARVVRTTRVPKPTGLARGSSYLNMDQKKELRTAA